MPAPNKLSTHVRPLLLPALLLATLLAVCVGQRQGGPPTTDLPPGNWDIPRLTTYLNRQGLGLRLVPTMQGSDPNATAFLTTTDKGWSDLNRLPKDCGRVHEWRGTLYCERGPGGEDWSDLARQWGDCCLVTGPFLFFGDPELLARVKDALADV
jgi:hypothetical protein